MTMEVIGRYPTSSLNPNAAPFVPQAYRAVEDFSEAWWELVQSSPWFCDYWMNECFQEPLQSDDSGFDEFEVDPFLPEIDALFDECFGKQDEDEKKWSHKDLVVSGGNKWRKSRAESPRFMEKAPKIVNVKVSPRPIQQPR
uniref:Uncharacterized protein n=1 Tax=Kalanchoe fedtschenkoi TaxID=63787 RepID=A0A7N0UUF9_KALFE